MAPLRNVSKDNSFEEQRVILNQVAGDLGNLDSLNTSSKASLISAINELQADTAKVAVNQDISSSSSLTIPFLPATSGTQTLSYNTDLQYVPSTGTLRPKNITISNTQGIVTLPEGSSESPSLVFESAGRNKAGFYRKNDSVGVGFQGRPPQIFFNNDGTITSAGVQTANASELQLTNNPKCLYVSEQEYYASDSWTNNGLSLNKPFKTITRALLEAARQSYVVDTAADKNNDKFEFFTIIVFPGNYEIDNRPGDSLSVENAINFFSNRVNYGPTGKVGFAVPATIVATTTTTFVYNQSTITVASAAGIVAGLRISGPDIPQNTFVGSSYVNGSTTVPLVNSSGVTVQTTGAQTNVSIDFYQSVALRSAVTYNRVPVTGGSGTVSYSKTTSASGNNLGNSTITVTNATGLAAGQSVNGGIAVGGIPAGTYIGPTYVSGSTTVPLVNYNDVAVTLTAATNNTSLTFVDSAQFDVQFTGTQTGGEIIVKTNRLGNGYYAGELLTIAAANLGGTGMTILITELYDDSELSLQQNLYRLNPPSGGVIVPRGTSIVGLDLRKTVIRPKYVPDPTIVPSGDQKAQDASNLIKYNREYIISEAFGYLQSKRITKTVSTITHGALLYDNTGTVNDIYEPDVFTCTGHGFVENTPIKFVNIPASGTTLLADQVYYVDYVDANSFRIKKTKEGAPLSDVVSSTQSSLGSLAAYSFNVGSVSCKRDIGYYIDALVYDLSRGGNSKTYDTAEYYVEGLGTQLIKGSTEIADTLTCLRYATNLAASAVRNHEFVLRATRNGTTLTLSTAQYGLTEGMVVTGTGISGTVKISSITYATNGSATAVTLDTSIGTGTADNYTFTARNQYKYGFTTPYYDIKFDTYPNFDNSYVTSGISYTPKCNTQVSPLFTLFNFYSTILNNPATYIVYGNANYVQKQYPFGYDRDLESALFRVTGGCYFWQMTFKDGDAINRPYYVNASGDLVQYTALQNEPTDTQKEALRVLNENRSTIINATYAALLAQYPTFTFGAPNGSTTAVIDTYKAKCKRDIGYVFDSVATDIFDGGNANTIDAARFYLNATENGLSSTGLAGEVTQSTFAFNDLRDRMRTVVVDDALDTKISLLISYITDTLANPGSINFAAIRNENNNTGQFPCSHHRLVAFKFANKQELSDYYDKIEAVYNANFEPDIPATSTAVVDTIINNTAGDIFTTTLSHNFEENTPVKFRPFTNGNITLNQYKTYYVKYISKTRFKLKNAPTAVPFVSNQAADAAENILANATYIANEAYFKINHDNASAISIPASSTFQDCLDDVVDVLKAVAYNVKFGYNNKAWEAANIYATGRYVTNNKIVTVDILNKARDYAINAMRNTTLSETRNFITWGGNISRASQTVTVNTGRNHGYSTGDRVVISASNTAFNTTDAQPAIITVTSNTQFTYLTSASGAIATGSTGTFRRAYSMQIIDSPVTSTTFNASASVSSITVASAAGIKSGYRIIGDNIPVDTFVGSTYAVGSTSVPLVNASGASVTTLNSSAVSAISVRFAEPITVDANSPKCANVAEAITTLFSIITTAITNETMTHVVETVPPITPTEEYEELLTSIVTSNQSSLALKVFDVEAYSQRVEENRIVGDASQNTTIDTVSSASPYIFNCSLRSVYGMSGMHANGEDATGFKSMVLAQYTGISLQRDNRAFTRLNFLNGQPSYKVNSADNRFTKVESEYIDYWRNYHVKASNNGFLQVVSVFAVGYADHFVSDTGSDISITNSNSNFGNIATLSVGYKEKAFPQDTRGQIVGIIPPKGIDYGRTNAVILDEIDYRTITKWIASRPENGGPGENYFGKIYVKSTSVNGLYEKDGLPEYTDETGKKWLLIDGVNYLLGKGKNIAYKEGADVYETNTTQNEYLYGSFTKFNGSTEQGEYRSRLRQRNANNPLDCKTTYDALVVTKSSISYSTSSSSIIVSDATGITAGQKITSDLSGIPVNTYVSSSYTSGTTIPLVNASGTAVFPTANQSAATLSFYRLIDVTANANRQFYGWEYQETVAGVDLGSLVIYIDEHVFYTDTFYHSEYYTLVQNRANQAGATAVFPVPPAVSQSTLYTPAGNSQSGISFAYNDAYTYAYGNLLKRILQRYDSDVNYTLNTSDNLEFEAGSTIANAYIKRVADARLSKDHIWRFVYKIPKESNAKPPERKYVIQLLSDDAPSYSRSYYIYDVETIDEYVADTQDGIYYLTVLDANVKQIRNSTSSLATGYGQNQYFLYPEVNLDNPEWNPKEALSVYDNDVKIRTVVLDTNNLTTDNYERVTSYSITGELTKNFVNYITDSNARQTSFPSGALTSSTTNYSFTNLKQVYTNAIYNNIGVNKDVFSGTSYSDRVVKFKRTSTAAPNNTELLNVSDIEKLVVGAELVSISPSGGGTLVAGVTVTITAIDLEQRKVTLSSSISVSSSTRYTYTFNNPIAIKIHRPSNIRASGHTWEYVGYGPGNYSTAFPVFQTIVLNRQQIINSQTIERNGGFNGSSGTNSNGDFFIGTQVIDTKGSQSETVNVPKLKTSAQNRLIDPTDLLFITAASSSGTGNLSAFSENLQNTVRTQLSDQSSKTVTYDKVTVANLEVGTNIKISGAIDIRNSNMNNVDATLLFPKFSADGKKYGFAKRVDTETINWAASRLVLPEDGFVTARDLGNWAYINRVTGSSTAQTWSTLQDGQYLYAAKVEGVTRSYTFEYGANFQYNPTSSNMNSTDFYLKIGKVPGNILTANQGLSGFIYVNVDAIKTAFPVIKGLDPLDVNGGVEWRALKNAWLNPETSETGVSGNFVISYYIHSPSLIIYNVNPFEV